MGVGVAAYVGTKLIAYVAVVYAGYRSLAPSVARPAWSSIVVGVARFIMGMGFGLLIYAASSTLFTSLSGFPLRSVITYIAVYVPTRWLEWSSIALIISPSARNWTGFLFGTARTDRRWRLLGIVVSCAADTPLMLTVGGLPIGRFLC